MSKAQRIQPRLRRKSRPIVVLSFRHPEELDQDLAQGLLEEAGKRDWALLDLNLTGGVLSDEQPPDGAIVTWLPDDPIPTQLRDMRVPTVRLGKRSHPDDTHLPAVYPDHDHAGRMVAEYFAGRGFRDLACVTHEGNRVMRLTYDAMRTRAAELGCNCHLHLFNTPENRVGVSQSPSERFDARMRGINAWLADLPKPVAIFTYGDQMAAQLCFLCQRAGFLVPEQVAVLGRGNTEVWCLMAPVPISSLDTNRTQHTRLVVQLLDSMMQGKPAPERTLVPPAGIVTRRSTDILAAADPDVVRAVRFIWDHLDLDLSVDDVAQEVDVPRYKLERSFRKHLNRGVKEELQRIRMERLCELLRSTTLPMAELAPQVGFRSVEYLHNAFRKTYGTTPRAYRLQMTPKDADDAAGA